MKFDSIENLKLYRNGWNGHPSLELAQHSIDIFLYLCDQLSFVQFKQSFIKIEERYCHLTFMFNNSPFQLYLREDKNGNKKYVLYLRCNFHSRNVKFLENLMEKEFVTVEMTVKEIICYLATNQDSFLTLKKKIEDHDIQTEKRMAVLSNFVNQEESNIGFNLQGKVGKMVFSISHLTENELNLVYKLLKIEEGNGTA